MMGLKADATATGRLVDIIRNGRAGPAAARPQSSPAGGLFSLFGTNGRDRRTIGVAWRNQTLFLAETRLGSATPPVLQGVQVTPIPAGMRPGDDTFAVFLRKQISEFCGTMPDIDIWTALPDEQAEQWHFRIAKVPPKERDEVAYWTAKKEHDFDERQSVFDCVIGDELIEQGVPKFPVSATIAGRAALHDMRNIIQRTGFALKGVTTRAAAMQNLFSSGWVSAGCEQYAVVHMDEDWTRIDIYSGTSVMVSRVVKTGFASIIRAVVESYMPTPVFADMPPAGQDVPANIPGEAQVRERLLEESMGDMQCAVATPLTHSIDALHERIAPAIDRLLRQLERTMGHFTNTLGYPQISKLFVATPGGCLRPLLEQFSQYLGLPCASLHSLRGAMTPGAELDLAKLPAEHRETVWAIGLSLSHEGRTQNCVHTFRERRQEDKRLRLCRHIAIGSAVAVALTAVFASYTGTQLAAAKHRQQELRQKLAAFGETMDEQKMMLASVQVQSLRKAVRALSERQVGVAFVSELSSVTPEAVRLSGVRLTRIEPQLATSGKKSAQADEKVQGSAMAIVTGTVSGDILQREAALADFLYRLERSPLVLSVTVEKKGDESGLGAETLQFVATLKLV
jgi:Tfp pilus assembly PilM family ATPase